MNIGSVAPYGVRSVSFNPSLFTSEPTYVQKPIVKAVSNTMPVTDWEDISLINPNVLTEIGTIDINSFNGKQAAQDLSVAGYAGTANNTYAPDAPLGPVHVIIITGLKTTTLSPFKLTLGGAIEAVLAPNVQYLNPPSRPDYSKETIEKVFELACIQSNVWI